MPGRGRPRLSRIPWAGLLLPHPRTSDLIHRRHRLFVRAASYVNVFACEVVVAWLRPLSATSARVPPNEDKMPKTKVRKKDVYTPPPDRLTPVKAKLAGPSNPVYVGVMLAMMVIGLAWLVVTYLASDQISFMSALGSWNFAIGFGLMVAGLLMTMRWR